MPRCSWQQTRNVRVDTPMAAQRSGMYTAWSGLSCSAPQKRRITRPCHWCASRSAPVSAPPRQPTMASTRDCSAPRAASGCARISGASSASCATAACRRCNRAISAAGGVTDSVLRGGTTFAAADRCAGQNHRLDRQRHRAPGGHPGGLEEGVIPLADPQNGGRVHLNACPDHVLARLGAEQNGGAAAGGGCVDNPRQGCGAAIHPETMQLDAGELGREMAATGDRDLGRCLTERVDVVVGLRERQDSAAGHESTSGKKRRRDPPPNSRR